MKNKAKITKIAKSDIKIKKETHTLKAIITDILWKKQGGVCFCCDDALDWEWHIVSFEENPTINEMGIVCRSCFNKYRPKRK